MDTKIVKDLFGRLVRITVKHAPEILAGIGIAGFCTTTALAVKATPEAEKLIEEKKEETQKEELTVKETVLVAWKPYVPALVTGASSALCIIGSVSTSLRRNAALTTAYEMSRTFIDNYRAEVRNTIGERKEEKILHEVNEKRVKENAVQDLPNDPKPSGMQEFIFGPTGTKFWSTVTKVKEDIADLMEQQKNSSENYIGVVDILAYFGAFDYKSTREKDMIIDTWTYFGYSLFHQQELLHLWIDDKAIYNERTGRFELVINANLQPMDDYWTLEPK